MKQNKWIYIIILMCLIIGLYCRNMNQHKAFQQTEFLFNTECNITAYGKDAKLAVEKTFTELKRINDLTDMYNKNSEISKINSSPSNIETKTDKAIIEMLKVAQEISLQSNGAFDLTIASVTKLWDFGAENPRLPDSATLSKALESVNFKNIIINESNCSVTKLNSDTMLDLGSVAKGYAADIAAESLKTQGITGAIIDLGGNIMCIGENPNTDNKKWRIGIQLPFAPTGEYSEITELSEGAVVSSGSYQRGFVLNGKRYHHILETKTGYPAIREYNSVTITANNALLADCLSTACFVLGEEHGASLAKKYNAEILFQ